MNRFINKIVFNPEYPPHNSDILWIKPNNSGGADMSVVFNGTSVTLPVSGSGGGGGGTFTQIGTQAGSGLTPTSPVTGGAVTIGVDSNHSLLPYGSGSQGYTNITNLADLTATQITNITNISNATNVPAFQNLNANKLLRYNTVNSRVEMASLTLNGTDIGDLTNSTHLIRIAGSTGTFDVSIPMTPMSTSSSGGFMSATQYSNLDSLWTWYGGTSGAAANTYPVWSGSAITWTTIPSPATVYNLAVNLYSGSTTSSTNLGTFTTNANAVQNVLLNLDAYYFNRPTATPTNGNIAIFNAGDIVDSGTSLTSIGGNKVDVAHTDGTATSITVSNGGTTKAKLLLKEPGTGGEVDLVVVTDNIGSESALYGLDQYAILERKKYFGTPPTRTFISQQYYLQDGLTRPQYDYKTGGDGIATVDNLFNTAFTSDLSNAQINIKNGAATLGSFTLNQGVTNADAPTVSPVNIDLSSLHTQALYTSEVITGSVGSNLTNLDLTQVNGTPVAGDIIYYSGGVLKVTNISSPTYDGTVIATTVAGATTIIDNLTSTATNAALSANQGKVVNDDLQSHKTNTSNPHSVTLAQAETAQGTTDLVINHNIYKGSNASGNELVTENEVISLATNIAQGTPMYMGQLKYGADNVVTLGNINSYGLTVGDICGVAQTQLSYEYTSGSVAQPNDQPSANSGFYWRALTHGVDIVGQYYDVVFWFGTWLDGITYDGDASAKITCSIGAFSATTDYNIGDKVYYTDDHIYQFTVAHNGAWNSSDVTDLGAMSNTNAIFDLIVYVDELKDNEVTDVKIGNRSVNDVATDTATASGKNLTAWLQQLYSNIKALLARFDTTTGHDHDGTNSKQIDYNDLLNQPTSLPISGTAGGALAGTYPNPTLAAVTRTDTTSTSTSSGTLSYVSSVSTNSGGQLTGINIDTATLPAGSTIPASTTPGDIIVPTSTANVGAIANIQSNSTLANSYIRLSQYVTSIYLIGITASGGQGDVREIANTGIYINPGTIDGGGQQWNYVYSYYPLNFNMDAYNHGHVINGVNLHSDYPSTAFLNGTGYYSTVVSAESGEYTLYLNKTTLSGTSFPINANYSGTSDIDLGLATVAWSGSYNDLSNKPSIPTVNSSQITLQKNGTQIGAFTLNQANSDTINIQVDEYPSADATKLAGIAAGAQVNRPYITDTLVNDTTGVLTINALDCVAGNQPYVHPLTSSTAVPGSWSSNINVGSTSVFIFTPTTAADILTADWVAGISSS